MTVKVKSGVIAACVVVCVAVSVAWLAFVSWLLQWGWNAVLPDVLGFPVLSYWQAVGLMVMFHIVTGGFSFSVRMKP